MTKMSTMRNEGAFLGQVTKGWPEHSDRPGRRHWVVPPRNYIALLTEKARSLLYNICGTLLYKICGTSSTQAKARGFTRTPEEVRNLLLKYAVKSLSHV
jgi:hypothetical protein